MWLSKGRFQVLAGIGDGREELALALDIEHLHAEVLADFLRQCGVGDLRAWSSQGVVAAIAVCIEIASPWSP